MLNPMISKLLKPPSKHRSDKKETAAKSARKEDLSAGDAMLMLSGMKRTTSTVEADVEEVGQKRLKLDGNDTDGYQFIMPEILSPRKHVPRLSSQKNDSSKTAVLSQPDDPSLTVDGLKAASPIKLLSYSLPLKAEPSEGLAEELHSLEERIISLNKQFTALKQVYSTSKTKEQLQGLMSLKTTLHKLNGKNQALLNRLLTRMKHVSRTAKKTLLLEQMKEPPPEIIIRRPIQFDDQGFSARFGSIVFDQSSLNKIDIERVDPSRIPALRNKVYAKGIDQNDNDLEVFVKDIIKKTILPTSTYHSTKRFDMMLTEDYLELVSSCIKIVEKEPTLMRVNGSVKVFGDIHGNLKDMLSLFRAFGAPQHYSGDISTTTYIFMGDYVDRGKRALEVLAILFAIKILYPVHVVLLRGNHEFRDMHYMGFKKECKRRLRDDPDMSIYEKVNELFNLMPLACVVDESILCVHGGIGKDISTLAQIAAIRRPITVITEDATEENKFLRDLLWSDPVDHETLEIDESRRGPNIFRYGAERVEQFCADNKIQLILRAHERVEAGYELFTSGKLLTIFSTNYNLPGDPNGAALAHIYPEINPCEPSNTGVVSRSPSPSNSPRHQPCEVSSNASIQRQRPQTYIVQIKALTSVFKSNTCAKSQLYDADQKEEEEEDAEAAQEDDNEAVQEDADEAAQEGKGDGESIWGDVVNC